MKIADKLLPFMYIKEYAICNIVMTKIKITHAPSSIK